MIFDVCHYQWDFILLIYYHLSPWFSFWRFLTLCAFHLLRQYGGNRVNIDVEALQDFRNKFASDTAIRSLLFEQLKSQPKMQFIIDKFRNASSSSSKRSWTWLYEKLVEAIEIHQLEENTVSLEKSLANVGNKETPAAPAKQEKDKDKPEKEKSKKESKPSKPDKPDKSKDKQLNKPSKESKPSKEDVNAAAAKGKGKGKDEKSKKDKNKDKIKKKQPCVYFGYDSCSKGKDCPYLHGPNNNYQGPKPKGLQKGSNSSAGAATVLAATCLASQAEPALGSVANSFNAPQPQEAGDSFGGVPT